MSVRGRVAVATALVAAATLGAVTAATASTDHTPHVTGVGGGGSGTVVRASVVCPDLRTLPGTLTTVVGVGTGTPGAGAVTLAAAVPERGIAAPDAPILGAGGRLATYAGPLTGPIVLDAQGPLTGALVAEQLSRGNKTSDRGWAEARCEPPQATQWFVGAATAPGDNPVLVLSNPAATAAVTDVAVFTPTGEVDSTLGENIALPPHSVTRLQLAQLAPGATATAVEVQTPTGAVSAAVRDVRTHGETLYGTDWVPVGSLAPSVTVAGIPGRVVGENPARTLYVADPGDADATVSLKVTSAAGTFVPSGLDAVTVPAGTVKAIPLGDRLGRSSAAVTVTSDDPTIPIVAGALVDAVSVKGTGIHEIAFVGSDAPLRGAALVPLIRLSTDADDVLVLSAPAGPARATLTVVPPTGTATTTALSVTGGRSVELSLKAQHVVDGATVTVTPAAGSGPLYVTRWIEENGALGPLISDFELRGAPPRVDVPRVAALPLG